MILRKLAEAIRTQNWFTVVLEILVVVIGIFIGLQVGDWNQARKDRIDEADFLRALHDDVLRAEELSHRVRQRKLDRLDTALRAADVLFSRNERNTLTDDECMSIVWLTSFNVTATGLPSVDELIGTGRMDIIRDAELRTGLVALQQTRAALDAIISEKSASSNFVILPTIFPKLFKLSVYIEDTIGEVVTRNACDLAGMRANQPFLNQFSINIDGYDAYIRDGVKPWSSQFDRVHTLVDIALGVDHDHDVSE